MRSDFDENCEAGLPMPDPEIFHIYKYEKYLWILLKKIVDFSIKIDNHLYRNTYEALKTYSHLEVIASRGL